MLLLMWSYLCYFITWAASITFSGAGHCSPVVSDAVLDCPEAAGMSPGAFGVKQLPNILCEFVVVSPAEGIS